MILGAMIRRDPDKNHWDNQRIKNSKEIKEIIDQSSDMFKIRRSSILHLSEKPQFQSSKSGQWDPMGVSSKESAGVECFNLELGEFPALSNLKLLFN